MGASSVTGTGQGDSHGVYKPEHNNGCGCKKEDPSPKPLPGMPIGCFVKTNSSNTIKIRTGGSISIKVC